MQLACEAIDLGSVGRRYCLICARFHGPERFQLMAAFARMRFNALTCFLSWV